MKTVFTSFEMFERANRSETQNFEVKKLRTGTRILATDREKEKIKKDDWFTDKQVSS